MELEIANRRDTARQCSVPLMREAAARLRRAQFCLLDGDHRALAAALLDRSVEADVIETPGHLDEYRRQAPEFPHEVALDLRAVARKWLDYAFGSLDLSTFSVETMTVAERAAALLKPGHLPEEAHELLLRSGSPPTVTGGRCSCPARPGTPGGATTWRDYAEQRSACEQHGAEGRAQN